jgi:hypothetical protein
MFFFGGTWWFCWPVVAIQWGVSRDLVTRNWTNPPDYMMVQFFGPEMKNNLIWEGIEFATQKILCEGCKLQKNENIGATVLNCLCITNWVRSDVFPMVCLWYGSCYKKRFKGDVLCVQTSLTQLSSCNISVVFFSDQFPSNAHFSATFIRNGCA